MRGNQAGYASLANESFRKQSVRIIDYCIEDEAKQHNIRLKRPKILAKLYISSIRNVFAYLCLYRYFLILNKKRIIYELQLQKSIRKMLLIT